MKPNLPMTTPNDDSDDSDDGDDDCPLARNVRPALTGYSEEVALGQVVVDTKEEKE